MAQFKRWPPKTTLVAREFEKARKRPWFRLKRLWFMLQAALIRLAHRHQWRIDDNLDEVCVSCGFGRKL